ncbi:MAG TPA: 50S ribosomal protein L10 [Candidatus Nanoarchaeia archaeon]|nr:50S ribosomal protein L10 [Candidatus Nanoarchaeia archaeon]
MAKTAHVAQEKKDVVAQMQKLMQDYPIVAILNMESMPAPQMQKIRSQMRGKADILMTKRRLMKIAIDKVKDKKKNIEAIIPHLKGMPALLFTKDNPFAIYKFIGKNKSPAPAKAGQEAPKDIIVPAGPTPFAPGPIIGELGAFKIKTGVENGKVVIKQDCVVAKAGDKINAALASVLTRLGIQPMEIGLDITAIYEDGMIYTRSVLDVDESQYIANVLQAHSWALNLGVEAGIFNTVTTEVMLQKAFRESKAVALEGNILADAVVGELLAKAEAEASSIKSASGA